MATRARPLPLDPYNPIPNDSSVVRHPSPFLPIRLPIFAAVIWLNDSIVRFLSVGASGGARPNASRPGHNGGKKKGESISFDVLEEGDVLGTQFTPAGATGELLSGRRRVKLAKKKLD